MTFDPGGSQRLVGRGKQWKQQQQQQR